MSTVDAKSVTLRDGRAVTLREPCEDDARAMLDYLDAVRRETDHILFSPHDPLPTLAEERKIVKTWTGPRAFHQLAEVDGRVVALAGVACMEKHKTRHRANLGISVLQAYHGVGLGRVLMNELIAWCRAQPELQKVCLTVYADNETALKLYTSCGFVTEGRMMRNICAADGRWVDELVMGLWVGDNAAPEPIEITVDDELTLRRVRDEDAAELYALIDRNREHLRPWLSWAPGVRSVNEVRGAIIEWNGQTDGSLTMALVVGGRIVGLIYHLRMNRHAELVEIGYWLDVDNRGRGLMTRALRAIADYSHDTLGLARVYLTAGAGNAPSRAVAERAGFAHEGVLRRSVRLANGELVDLAYYASIRENHHER